MRAIAISLLRRLVTVFLPRDRGTAVGDATARHRFYSVESELSRNINNGRTDGRTDLRLAAKTGFLVGAGGEYRSFVDASMLQQIIVVQYLQTATDRHALQRTGWMVHTVTPAAAAHGKQHRDDLMITDASTHLAAPTTHATGPAESANNPSRRQDITTRPPDDDTVTLYSQF